MPASASASAAARPITLPVSGRQVRNRFAKAATTECLAHPLTNLPNSKHNELYRTWGGSGCGIIITGNVMIDPRYMEAPRNCALYLDEESGGLSAARKAAFGAYAASIHDSDASTLAIVQLSHPGRQCPMSVNTQPIAPSAVAVSLAGLGPLSRVLLRSPREMTLEEIGDVVERFGRSAALCEECGFDGIQIHCAHGYLISQFLSPRSNRRVDRYGGSPENRRRLLLEIIDRCRELTSSNFVVGVKINSSDFQSGGFTSEESFGVLDALHQGGGRGQRDAPLVDFIELSGGTYENAEMMKNPPASMKASTRRREGFFLEFAEQVIARRRDSGGAGAAGIPLMLTGGFRSREGIEGALESIDIVGLARPLCVSPDFPQRYLDGSTDGLEPYSVEVKGFLAKTLTPGLNNFWHQQQIARIADRKTPDRSIGFVWALTGMFARAYVWDPAKHPRTVKVLACALIALFSRRLAERLALPAPIVTVAGLALASLVLLRGSATPSKKD